MKIENVNEVIERYQLATPNRARTLVYKNHATILHGLRCYTANIKYQDFKDINERIEQELNLAICDIEPESKLQLTDIEIDILDANNIHQFWEVKNKLIKKLSIK